MITKQALVSTLFGMAGILRDKVEDYKAYILSLLFFKRLSDNYEWETENEIKESVKRGGRQPTERELEIIPRYMNTFEPEEEIDLKQGITEFKATLNQKTDLDKPIDELLKLIY
jgi:type I restriction enzyme M protein